ncbi:MAG TPA: fumarylacetoacetate hydrolase family protein [Candidatus Acidoferrales bacterium]|nr:fumarylacetoacetate hydrolase family protein [Candidatus Acidoferrales bacterium]
MTKFIRYSTGASTAFGILDGDTVREIQGGLFDSRTPSGVTHKLTDVKLLYPLQPGKILAVGLNYKSHLGNRPQPAHPEMFYKPLSALQNPGDPIAIPRDATDVHSEGEMVVVVGKKLHNAGVAEARDAVFGVTAGNDVSDRNWQHGEKKDLQWWRAKGSDTFAPLGPAILAGADYGKLLLQTRINGETVQKQYTSDLIFDVPAILSWVSGWVTLQPGDIIYTGTPGNTRRMSPGDVVEVELEQAGVLRNPVV